MPFKLPAELNQHNVFETSCLPSFQASLKFGFDVTPTMIFLSPANDKHWN
jgi:hypothetical protein